MTQPTRELLCFSDLPGDPLPSVMKPEAYFPWQSSYGSRRLGNTLSSAKGLRQTMTGKFLSCSFLTDLPKIGILELELPGLFSV